MQNKCTIKIRKLKPLKKAGHYNLLTKVININSVLPIPPIIRNTCHLFSNRFIGTVFRYTGR